MHNIYFLLLSFLFAILRVVFIIFSTFSSTHMRMCIFSPPPSPADCECREVTGLIKNNNLRLKILARPDFQPDSRSNV